MQEYGDRVAFAAHTINEAIITVSDVNEIRIFLTIKLAVWSRSIQPPNVRRQRAALTLY